uniref:G protein-coupled receptor n=1 Tax=Plectus sambesii TaxID=2011161 RepID=A0A914WT04_9BILA
MVTLCMLALERIRATIDYRTYEKAGSFHGYLLAAIQWTIVFVAMIILIFNSYTNSSGERKLACLLTTQNSTKVASLMMLTMAIAEIASLATFYSLLHLNQRKRLAAGCSTLTEKYQIDENIRCTKLMIPIVWTHFLLLFPPMCSFAVYAEIDDRIDRRTFAILIAASDWTPWYCLMLPIVIFWRQKSLRVALRRKLQEMGLNTVNPLESQTDRFAQEQARHFDLLNTMWNSQSAR